MWEIRRNCLISPRLIRELYNINPTEATRGNFRKKKKKKLGKSGLRSVTVSCSSSWARSVATAAMGRGRGFGATSKTSWSRKVGDAIVVIWGTTTLTWGSAANAR